MHSIFFLLAIRLVIPAAIPLIAYCIGQFTDGTPDLTTLWFGNDPEVKSIRVSTFLAVFDLQDFSEDLKSFDTPLVAVICLVAYIANQVRLTYMWL